MHTVPPAPSTLGPATAALTAGAEHLALWHSNDTTGARVRSGHDAIAAIDVALRALHDARALLVGEIYADNVERDVRIAELLAQVRAERFGHPDGYDYRREVEDQGADDVPLPPGADGWRIEGAR